MIIRSHQEISSCLGGTTQLLHPEIPPQFIGHTEKYGISIYSKDYLITDDVTGEQKIESFKFTLFDDAVRPEGVYFLFGNVLMHSVGALTLGAALGYFGTSFLIARTTS